jgi:anaerobic magnesium-protoporphyrin IX monomethyl ester cyclase
MCAEHTHGCDIHLIFPPQWSPFQPFLSTPSLKAYLEGKGFAVRQSDWNVDFYEHFIDRERLPGAIARLERYARELPTTNEQYRNQAYLALGILADHERKRARVNRLRSVACVEDVEDFHASVTAFKRLLHAFSVAEPIIEMGTSSLSTGRVMRTMAGIHDFCANPENNPFLDFFRRKVAAIDEVPRYFGLSIIGTEQILPSLTLGACLKARFPDVPVLVGGSVFSRMIERTETILPLFGRYFDLVVRYEGEAPVAQLLASSDPKRDRTSNIVFAEDGQIVVTPLGHQLAMEAIPTPDFDGLDLRKYFTPEVVLPVLSTRGCYWDKCAFCYHGMIYGDRYRMRSPEMFNADIVALNAKYGARHFALNDEAIPPKLFEKLPAVIEPRKYFFTGLYKFEKYFEPHHYRGMYEIGFRSLYIGLESANERVQRHMKKNNTRPVMVSNLNDAHDAGIWNHTFNFFGFPTETEDEALDTAQFLIDHKEVIHSEGTGTFSFEHNAPIFKHPEAFGITRVIEKTDNVLELYYDYEVTGGLDGQGAAAMVERFRAMKRDAKAYQYSGWIPREHLLVMLSHHDRDSLRRRLEVLDNDIHAGARWSENVNWFWMTEANRERYFVVNAQAGKILETNKDAVVLLTFLPQEMPAAEVAARFPVFAPVLQG